MKTILPISLLLLLAPAALFSQQESMISQYMYNGLFVNPAAAGSNLYWNATALYRNQWVGFEGTPVTEILCIDGRIKSKNVGLGFSAANDQIGVSKRTDA